MVRHYRARSYPQLGMAAAASAILLSSACGGSPGPSAPTTPPPTVQPPSVVSRWVGTSPNGMIVEQEASDYCPAEFDLELNLTITGNVVTGTSTTRLRRVEAQGPCTDVLGGVYTYGLMNGQIDGDRISVEFGTGGTYRLTGTIGATQMTGTFTFTDFPQGGGFSVTRQERAPRYPLAPVPRRCPPQPRFAAVQPRGEFVGRSRLCDGAAHQR